MPPPFYRFFHETISFQDVSKPSLFNIVQLVQRTDSFRRNKKNDKKKDKIILSFKFSINVPHFTDKVTHIMIEIDDGIVDRRY